MTIGSFKARFTSFRVYEYPVCVRSSGELYAGALQAWSFTALPLA